MEVGPLVVLGLMWVVLNALRKGGSRPGGKAPSSRPPSPGRADGAGPAGLPTSLSGAGAQKDPTQREGSQLEQLLRDLGRSLDQAGQQRRQPTIRTLPPARSPAPAKRGEALVGTEGQSLEVESVRGERPVQDLDDEAERVVERRAAAAEANLRPLSEADHRVFDDQIRQEPTDKTASRAYTQKQLRDAVVWREILGPPVSLRENHAGEW